MNLESVLVNARLNLESIYSPEVFNLWAIFYAV